tara:strand:- start:2049 stop:3044 length:996 start_codon:yes stop_codon:yes gene_type:complete
VTRDNPILSIIVPLFNEEESIPLLYKKLCEAVDPMGISYEILLVNDGSKDRTFEVASKIAESDTRLRVIELRKNYGQTPAMAAGIDIARGEILATMDGDLQNDPSDIPMMFAKLHEGYDIVVGWRYKRQDKLITRKIPSMIANWLIGKVTGVPIKDNGCSLKLYRAELMTQMPFYNEMHRFIPALLSVSGSKVAQVKVKHHARQFGESKYGLSRVYKVLLDLLTIKTIGSVAHHPIMWFAKLATVPLILSLIIALISIHHLFAEDSNLVLPTISVLFMFTSFFLISLGILGEQIYKHGSIQVSKLSMITSRMTNLRPKDQQALGKKRHEPR